MENGEKAGVLLGAKRGSGPGALAVAVSGEQSGPGRVSHVGSVPEKERPESELLGASGAVDREIRESKAAGGGAGAVDGGPGPGRRGTWGVEAARVGAGAVDEGTAGEDAVCNVGGGGVPEVRSEAVAWGDGRTSRPGLR